MMTTCDFAEVGSRVAPCTDRGLPGVEFAPHAPTARASANTVRARAARRTNIQIEEIMPDRPHSLAGIHATAA